jgi:hypothetical protein
MGALNYLRAQAQNNQKHLISPSYIFFSFLTSISLSAPNCSLIASFLRLEQRDIFRFWAKFSQSRGEVENPKVRANYTLRAILLPRLDNAL